MSKIVGIAGIGIMGSAMSANLMKAGFEVVGFDPSAEALASHKARGGRVAGSPREVAEAAGFAWAFWNYFDGMGLTIDDASRAFDPSITAALGLRLPDGAGAQDRR